MIFGSFEEVKVLIFAFFAVWGLFKEEGLREL